jgi:hypothetical protein
LKRGTLVLALCDLGAKDQKEEDDIMLGIACSEAQAILFCFDLTKPASLIALQALFLRTTQVYNLVWMLFDVGMSFCSVLVKKCTHGIGCCYTFDNYYLVRKAILISFLKMKYQQ